MKELKRHCSVSSISIRALNCQLNVEVTSSILKYTDFSNSENVQIFCLFVFVKKEFYQLPQVQNLTIIHSHTPDGGIPAMGNHTMFKVLISGFFSDHY